MMDRVGALARSLGRPNHGMMQLRSTNPEPDISTMGEIMSYALGPSANPDKDKHKQRGWLSVAFEHMKIGVNGQPEATCSKIILSIATLIGLLGYDAYYILSPDVYNDDKMLTVIFCVLCIFIVEFYCFCACTQGKWSHSLLQCACIAVLPFTVAQPAKQQQHVPCASLLAASDQTTCLCQSDAFCHVRMWKVGTCLLGRTGG